MNVFKYFLLAVFIAAVPKLSFAEKVIFFKGQIDFTTNEFNILLDLDEKSSITAKTKRISENDYHLFLDIEHLKTPLFDLLSNIESSFEIVKDKEIALRGKVWSEYSLLDYKPINELSGTFELKDQKVQLTACFCF